MIKYTAIWHGLDEYQTAEHCTLAIDDVDVAATSTIAGNINDVPFKVDYIIEMDANWRITGFAVNYYIREKPTLIQYERDRKTDNWLNEDGTTDERFNGCNFIDISLTPFTNTLPVKRLDLQIGQSCKIKVIYIDVMEQQVRPAEQVYTRLTEDTYRFESPDDNFTADILFDKNGLVTGYPGLFKRTYFEG